MWSQIYITFLIKVGGCTYTTKGIQNDFNFNYHLYNQSLVRYTIRNYRSIWYLGQILIITDFLIIFKIFSICIIVETEGGPKSLCKMQPMLMVLKSLL